MADMSSVEENSSDEDDEGGSGKFPKYSKTEVGDLFTKLNSCIKERESSQKWFHNLLSSYSGAIKKGMNELIDEVDHLKDQLSEMKRERDDLLFDVGKFCVEIEELKAKIPHMTEGNESQQNGDADWEGTDLQDVKFTMAEEHFEEGIAQEKVAMTNTNEPEENPEKDALDLNRQDSDNPKEEPPDTEELHRKRITLGNVTQNNENLVESHTKDEDIGVQDLSSRTTEADNQEMKASESKQQPKLKCVKCEYATSQQDLLNLHVTYVHKLKQLPNGTSHFSQDELVRLKREFELNPFLNGVQRKNLAKELGRTENHIKSWFERMRRNLHLGNIHEIDVITRKNRTFNKVQLARLKQEFEQNPYPNKEHKINLSVELVADKTQISSWFASMRSKNGIKKSDQEKTDEKAQILTCKQCPYTTAMNYKLKHHVERVHDKIRNQVCEDCGYASYYKTALKLHMASEHGKGEIQMFSCDQCSFTAPTENRLRVHVKERHDKIKDQVCKMCGFAFSRKKDLHRHMVCVHKVGEKKFKCELCPIKFVEAHRLREHVRGVHEKIKDYVCEDCGYAAWQKNSLQLLSCIT